MADIHRARARRPTRQTSPREFAEREQKLFQLFRMEGELVIFPLQKRRYADDDDRAFYNRLARRRRKKGYKIGRQRRMLNVV
jgi:hypothetical protein